MPILQILNYSLIVLLTLFSLIGFLDRTVRRSRIEVDTRNINSSVQDKYINVYRTRDGRKNFIFRYVDVGRYYEIDILSQPSYGMMDSDLHASHRLPAHRRGAEYKICIMSGYEPRDLAKAMRISMDWAELTWKYIRTGESIDHQVSKR